MEAWFSQLSASVVGGLVFWGMYSWTKDEEPWVTAVSTILALAVLYGLAKFLKFAITRIRNLATHRRPSLREVAEKVRQDFLKEKKFNIALLWASTWLIGVWSPLLLMVPYREEVTVPAELVSVIGLVGMVPVTIVMSIGVLRMTWQDWKQSETKKQKIFWGIRILGVIAFTVTIMALREIYG